MTRVKLLIVDDTPANIISLEYLLNDYFDNIDILTATNGEEALKIAFENDINLIILDIQMPIMDGFETAQYLQKSSKTKNIPIIFLTAAFKKEEFQKKGFESGAVDYLTKPIDNFQFINKLRLYIELFRKNKELEAKQEEQNTLLSFFDKGDAVLLKWKNSEKQELVYISQSIEKLLGYSVEDFHQGKISFQECIYKDDKENVANEIVLNKEYDYFKHEQYRVKTKNNKIKWVNNYTAIQRDSAGEISYYIDYISDITEDKEKDELLFEQSKLASMGEMIGNIAHQWRQPLSVISTAATGLKLQKEYNLINDDSIINTCEIINKNAQFLSNTIDDFKNFLKEDRMKREFNLKENIEKFISLVDGSIHTHNIKVILEIPSDIKVTGFPNELNQCFINIFNNAKDALKINNIKDKLIIISAKILKDKIVISFKDNAKGIPLDIISKVFEPYFTTKHQSQGTGLGLHMTNNLIVNGMDGTIHVENEEFRYEGKDYTGANFIITLIIS